MDLKDRVHEWLADNFDGIQYPHIKRIPEWAQPEKKSLFKHQMPLSVRMFTVIASIGVLAFCAVVLFFLGVFFWAIFA